MKQYKEHTLLKEGNTTEAQRRKELHIELNSGEIGLDKFLFYIEESEVVSFGESAISENEVPVKEMVLVSESDSDAAGKGNPQEEAQANRLSEQSSTKVKKGRTNAERCKRHRQKLKFLKEQVYVDNQELKKERVELLKTISDLELEVESLRCRGLVDLSKENKLLREAIDNHQKYIKQVVEVALKAPLQVDSAEHTRLMKTGLENGARHIIGLAYSSIHSDLWKQAKSFPLVLEDGTRIENVRVWYQYLPLGVPACEARRINLRYDLPPLPLDWRKLAAAHWKVSSNVDLLQRQIESMDRVKHFKVREVTPLAKLSETEEMICLAISNENKKGVQNVFVSAIKDTEMYSMAFTDGDSLVNTGAQPVKIVLGSSCGTEERPTDSEAYLVHDLHPDGHIYREAGKGQCAITITSSDPLSGEYYEMVLGSVLKGEPMVSDEGELNDIFKYLSARQLSNIMSHYED